jgi:hypothetical protein
VLVGVVDLGEEELAVKTYPAVLAGAGAAFLIEFIVQAN